MTPKRVKEDRSVRSRFQLKMDLSRQREILGLALFAFGGLVLLVLLHITPTAISDRAAQFLRVLFGWGAFGLPVLAFIASAFLLRRGQAHSGDIAWGRVFAAEICFGVMLALLHLVTPTTNGAALADGGEGGGFIGWAISRVLASALGNIGAGAVLIVLALFTLPAILGLRTEHLRRWSEALASRAETTKRTARVLPAPRVRPPEPVDIPPEPADGETEPEGVVEPEPAALARPVFGKPAAAVVEPAKLSHPILTPHRRAHRTSKLPPVEDLLDPSDEVKYGEMDADEKKHLIVETLAQFGIPVEIKEVNVGPTITQFGLEPGFISHRSSDGQMRQRKVSVSRIAALQHDLELALAAAPIRIETPVPGRPIVGIEVPNQTISLVSLRGVLESDSFKKKRKPLKVALGNDVSGTPISADLGGMPHLLIAGATGSGKSVCINAIIACLLFNNSPDDLRLIMVDPKRVELTTFNNIPHLLGPVVVEMDQVVAALRWVVAEMESRFSLFAKTGVRNIEGYNEKAATPARAGGARESASEATMPYIIVLIDELADLMLASPDETEKYLTRLAQLARATGIHLVIATQRPSVDVVTGLIKANFPSRISFAVTSSVDSRVVLDTPGAEKLLGRGDMLYMASDSSKLLRLQGCFVSDQELARLVNFWRERAMMEMRDIVHDAPWKEASDGGTPARAGGARENGGGDELVEEATQLIRQSGTASISFLQRKLGIGYPRAARLMDQLEELGVVGPDQGGGKPRAILAPAPANPDRTKKRK